MWFSERTPTGSVGNNNFDWMKRSMYSLFHNLSLEWTIQRVIWFSISMLKTHLSQTCCASKKRQVKVSMMARNRVFTEQDAEKSYIKTFTNLLSERPMFWRVSFPRTRTRQVLPWVQDHNHNGNHNVGTVLSYVELFCSHFPIALLSMTTNSRFSVVR